MLTIWLTVPARKQQAANANRMQRILFIFIFAISFVKLEFVTQIILKFHSRYDYLTLLFLILISVKAQAVPIPNITHCIIKIENPQQEDSAVGSLSLFGFQQSIYASDLIFEGDLRQTLFFEVSKSQKPLIYKAFRGFGIIPTRCVIT